MEPQLEGCGKSVISPPQPRRYMLQWSRNLRVAESRARLVRVRTLLASMEPQLEGCGKRRGGGPPMNMDDASMEPQLEGCGKVASAARSGPQFLLQWSRNLRVAESAGPSANPSEKP